LRSLKKHKLQTAFKICNFVIAVNQVVKNQLQTGL